MFACVCACLCACVCITVSASVLAYVQHGSKSSTPHAQASIREALLCLHTDAAERLSRVMMIWAGGGVVQMVCPYIWCADKAGAPLVQLLFCRTRPQAVHYLPADTRQPTSAQNPKRPTSAQPQCNKRQPTSAQNVNPNCSRGHTMTAHSHASQSACTTVQVSNDRTS